MPLIFDTVKNVFIKKEYKRHSGQIPCSANDYPESFYVNKFINIKKYDSSYFNFNTPLYYTLGGTLDYYRQDPYSIFTNTSLPFIKFIFTANTESFGTGTTIKHNIYKIPYSDFKKSGNTNVIIDELSNPILTITASTSDIITNEYNLFLNQYQKILGNTSFELFEDYSQYFISTSFQFHREQATGYTDFYQYDYSLKHLNYINFQTDYLESTPERRTVITAGTFSGISVTGNFFTYFLLPNKPKWQTPYVTGNLSTYTPTFYWSDTDDANSFLIQVVYNLEDSQTFSGTVYSYPIDKEKTNLSTNELLGTDTADWSITQKTTDITRKYSIPLVPNKTFWYRVGNVKELINIFGVKQQVVTFSDIKSATTAINTTAIDVRARADSPFVIDVPEFSFPRYLIYDIPNTEKYYLSGTVSGSIVTGATIQLAYPNGNYITQQTDVYGNYNFNSLPNGNYTLNTTYRGYQKDNRIVNLTGNTTVSFKLNLLWDNSFDTWGKMANDNYYI